MLDLHVYPWDFWGQWSPVIRKAKLTIDSSETLRPVEAKPGCGRVLVLGAEFPPFICCWVPVRSASLRPAKEALEWYLGLRDDGGNDEAAWLSHTLGRKVVALGEEVPRTGVHFE